ncbi:hypothetical protein NGB36_04150 [Streptomyces sp. RB6PN25]|uniref:Uncharacterized protein n=1 Tax=Streptomyces humicola TaxID=2953240 RepID=A0ABT1PQ40_9ACTN|nr:hypothetical protein [Streptomyces humicola]MCQ4079802.1 hypothetical protein [Streptomyces humicola]
MSERFDRPVRCSSGHVFTTIRLPLVSLKAVRVGPWRLQRCPVGVHWAQAAPLDPAEPVSPEECAAARSVHDGRIP